MQIVFLTPVPMKTDALRKQRNGDDENSPTSSVCICAKKPIWNALTLSQFGLKGHAKDSLSLPENKSDEAVEILAVFGVPPDCTTLHFRQENSHNDHHLVTASFFRDHARILH